MKKQLLTAVVAVLALQSVAVASPLPANRYLDQMPKGYRGTWCGVNDSKPVFTRSRGTECSEKSGDNVMQITADGYKTYESQCQHMKIINDRPRNPQSYDIKFFCAQTKDIGADGILPTEYAWTSVLTLRVVNGRLIVTPDT